ncbi:hypothetical protein PRIPAC_70438 [Pristionchus pacificus]|uniref:Uncharacterized protein n=1 Tax=Pristionchus pacificus TaxID=54126 RepID=A0A2A6C843_PRIPA|nr:hypothetical protein PRIPAC_70438 [Pristionchus pacificus]|eukprot:PDM74375.1 hypothetical protein PRIPAC_41731 [Pristionchus pacificus]
MTAIEDGRHQHFISSTRCCFLLPPCLPAQCRCFLIPEEALGGGEMHAVSRMTHRLNCLGQRVHEKGRSPGVQKSEAGCEVLIVSDCSIRAAEDGEGVDSSSAATTTGRRAAAAWSQAVDCPAAVAAALSVQPFLTDKRAAMKEKAGKGGDSRNSPRRIGTRALRHRRTCEFGSALCK